METNKQNSISSTFSLQCEGRSSALLSKMIKNTNLISLFLYLAFLLPLLLTWNSKEGLLTFNSEQYYQFISVQLSGSVMSETLWRHGLQHTRLPCPSPTPKACSKSYPSSQWCHPTISSSVVPFSSCLQSFPASGSFPVSHLFTSWEPHENTVHALLSENQLTKVQRKTFY